MIKSAYFLDRNTAMQVVRKSGYKFPQFASYLTEFSYLLLVQITHEAAWRMIWKKVAQFWFLSSYFQVILLRLVACSCLCSFALDLQCSFPHVLCCFRQFSPLLHRCLHHHLLHLLRMAYC